MCPPSRHGVTSLPGTHHAASRFRPRILPGTRSESRHLRSPGTRRRHRRTAGSGSVTRSGSCTGREIARDAMRGSFLRAVVVQEGEPPVGEVDRPGHLRGHREVACRAHRVTSARSGRPWSGEGDPDVLGVVRAIRSMFSEATSFRRAGQGRRPGVPDRRGGGVGLRQERPMFAMPRRRRPRRMRPARRLTPGPRVEALDDRVLPGAAIPGLPTAGPRVADSGPANGFTAPLGSDKGSIRAREASRGPSTPDRPRRRIRSSRPSPGRRG